MVNRSLQQAFRLIVLGGLCFAYGCGGNSGPPTYHVAGNVTFDGQPIPQGTIVFTPDLLKNNDGTQGVAEIKDGRYDTRLGRKLGSVGGPMKVSVTGLSADARPLCQYDFELDLPREDTTKDIEVPKAAASTGQPFEAP